MRVQVGAELGDLAAGVRVLAPELGLEVSEDGVTIHPVRWERDELRVERRGSRAEISFGGRAQFFRGLGLLAEQSISGGDFVLSEEVAFDSVGPMIDVSQGNAVPRVPFVKYLLRAMALMGLNMLMLYSEDSYEIPELPFFGYMRGRLTQAQLREIDDYADMLGIELIPCMQTLGHLYDVLKWKPFHNLQDDPYTLLVGDERTYDLIEEMIVSASRSVRSRRINIGMDEAWNLGRGRYLTHRGYRPKIEIMAEHLPRVMQIVERHGLSPMMWSDMFFRATSPSNAYDQVDVTLSDAAQSAVPPGVSLIYWSYHSPDPGFYRKWLERHVELGNGRPPVFAGGISNWRGWAPNYGMTFAATRAALTACKQVGVREVLATIWGDDGTECDLSACLLGLQLYAETCYGADTSEERLARRFKTCCHGDLADFMMLKEIDEVPGVPDGNPDSCNPSQYLLWQNALLGLFDANVRSQPLAEHYAQLGERLQGAIARNPAHREMFGLYRRLCAALARKAELGIQLTDAYQAGDRSGLRKLCEEIPEAIRAIRELHTYHRERWHAVYQPLGWEVMDARYGTVLLGLEGAAWRIEQYLREAVPSLEELEEHRLPFDGQDGHLSCQYVGRMQSASRLYWDAG